MLFNVIMGIFLQRIGVFWFFLKNPFVDAADFLISISMYYL